VKRARWPSPGAYASLKYPSLFGRRPVSPGIRGFIASASLKSCCVDFTVLPHAPHPRLHRLGLIEVAASLTSFATTPTRHPRLHRLGLIEVRSDSARRAASLDCIRGFIASASLKYPFSRLKSNRWSASEASSPRLH